MVLASYTGSANNWPSKGRMFGEKKKETETETEIEFCRFEESGNFN